MYDCFSDCDRRLRSGQVPPGEQQNYGRRRRHHRVLQPPKSRQIIFRARQLHRDGHAGRRANLRQGGAKAYRVPRAGTGRPLIVKEPRAKKGFTNIDYELN